MNKVFKCVDYVKQFCGFFKLYYFAAEIGRFKSLEEKARFGDLVLLSRKELAKTIQVTRVNNRIVETDIVNTKIMYNDARSIINTIHVLNKSKYIDTIINEYKGKSYE